MSQGTNVAFMPGASWQVGPAVTVRTMVDREDLLQQLENFRRLWEGSTIESGENIHSVQIDLALVLDDIEQMINGTVRF